MSDDGVRGTRPGRNPDKPRRAMRTVSDQVKRLAKQEADREIRLREGTADVYDKLSTRPDGSWSGLRNDIRREGDDFRAEARRDIARQLSEADRVNAFVALIESGLKGQDRMSHRTAAHIMHDFLKQPDTAQPFEDALLKRVGVGSVEELLAIVKKARATAEMDHHQRAQACERFLVRYYGVEGRTRQRTGLMFMGGELPFTSEDSSAVVEPDGG